MSVIVGRLAKTESAKDDVKLTQLWKRLPIPGVPTVRYFEDGLAELAIFDYGAAQEFEPLECQTGETKIFAQGVLTDEVRRWLPPLLASNSGRSNPISNPESVCGVSLSRDELRIFTSCSGSDGFLVLESSDSWVFSNHHSPLGAFSSNNEALDQTALAWSLVKYHNMKFGHHIKGIARTRPGSIWVASTERIQEYPMLTSWARVDRTD